MQSSRLDVFFLRSVKRNAWNPHNKNLLWYSPTGPKIHFFEQAAKCFMLLPPGRKITTLLSAAHYSVRVSCKIVSVRKRNQFYKCTNYFYMPWLLLKTIFHKNSLLETRESERL
ncbi:hypothetical protein L596_012673 [Steinernema carpocapsae]|uniref:Uncharacterized protein n=1 Tax=Steinernema carpocapsae TaxID=34508 RepID=A0A4U5NYE6_STECR|nr:hypothetical protein L596_012673 [Steinernema carpocapsae]